MSQNNSSKPTRHVSRFPYQDKQIECVFWSHLDPSTVPDTILFLGTGQVGKIPKWVADNAPAGTIVVQGMPHWQIDPSADDLVEFSLAYALHMFEAVRKVFGVARLHLIGTSQSTPGTIWLANHASKHVANVVLLAPMGLTSAQFGKTDAERLRELQRRARKTLFQTSQSPFRDKRNVYIAGLLLKILLAGVRDGSTANKYTKGIAQDMLEEFRSLVANPKHRVTLILGVNDALFPAAEVKAALRQANIEVQMEIIDDMQHASLALKSRRALLHRAVAIARSDI